MMSLSRITQLPRRNIVFLASCLGALIIFAAVVLLPNIYKARRQNSAIKQLQAQIAEQKGLNTLYLQLAAKLALMAKLDAELTVGSEPLQVREMSRIIPLLQVLADKKGVIVDQVQPVVESGSLPLHRLRIQAIMRGNLEQHRALLVDLFHQSYVDEIEQLTFEANGKDPSAPAIGSSGFL